MRDDEILAFRLRAADDVEGGHHGGGDAGDGRIGVAGLDGVDCFVAPRHSDVSLDLIDDLARGQGFGRRQSGYQAQKSQRSQ